MHSVSLLDCTLRDGGYINDWNFGEGTIVSIIERLCASGVELIEIGFLDERHQFDKNRTIQPTSDSYNFISFNKHQSKIVAMIDYGTCDIDNIQPKNQTIIDCIRIIFKKPKMSEAIAFAKKIKEKGYEISLQLVSMTSYSDRDLLDLIDMANNVNPFAVSIVDTYGLMHKEQVLHYLDILDNNLIAGIQIGYHSHNNFQLGYSNSIEFLSYNSKHDLLVDGTLYGMGKSAGNAPLELIAMHMNEVHGKSYDMESILEIIDSSIMPIYEHNPWGYTFNYYLSAYNDCHPNYVKYFSQKNTLSISSICEVISKIPEEKKLNYDENLAEKLYREYQSKEISDLNSISAFDKAICDSPILFLGPGPSLISDKKKIEQFIENSKPIVISVNCVPTEYALNYVFVTNSKRYATLFEKIVKCGATTLCTSNITPIPHSEYIVFNYEGLISSKEKVISDTSLAIILNLMKKINKCVNLAGFDGFKEGVQNYYDSSLTMKSGISQTIKNQQMLKFINKISKEIKIEFITDSLYR